jgi:hypothetical protein
MIATEAMRNKTAPFQGLILPKLTLGEWLVFAYEKNEGSIANNWYRIVISATNLVTKFVYVQ